MKTILYSMAGEGRGHATRVRSLIEELKDEYKIVLFAPDQAFELLEPVYKNSSVEVKNIPGLQWIYNKYKKLNYFRTGAAALNYINNLPGLVNQLCKEIDKHQPDLIITDFDPALPRAAKRCGIPFVSFDHQHFLTSYDLSSLPLHLRLKASAMRPFIDLFYTRQEETIVSSFYFPPVKKDKRIRQIGVLINKELMNINPKKGDYLLVYLRRFIDLNLHQSLLECGCPVKIYGLGKQRPLQNLTFHEIDYYKFIEDLANARALLSTAGNQLVGEALYLGKPVIAMPEPGNFEQEINAHFLEKSGAGIATSLKNISGNMIRNFLAQNDYHKLMINRKKICGNNDALRIIENYMTGKNKAVRENKIRASREIAVS